MRAPKSPPVSEPSPESEAAPPIDTAPSAEPRRTERRLGGFDAVLAVAIGIFAFLQASFAVRNSDFWMHLASGRLLARGEYQFGVDPFRYTSAGQYWTNHSWLADAGLYGVWSIFGEPAVVVVKALLVAALAGVLLATRRPGQQLWPGVVCTGLALLTASPRLLLQPTIVSFLFLGLTLLWLLRRPERPSWRWPAGLAALFALWANCDAWFLLGPLGVTLFLLGEWVEILLRTRPALSADAGTEPSAPRPNPYASLAPLAVALAAGILACMLGPHHAHVWELPSELSPTTRAALGDDPLGRVLRLGPLDKGYYLQPNLGYNVNGLAYLLLMLLGLAAFALDAAGRRWPHLLVWVVFGALGLVNWRFVPFFAVVAAPLTALHLAAGFDRLRRRLLARNDATAGANLRLVEFVRVFGRVLTLLAVAGLLVAGWPGWLHPSAGNPVTARRVAWQVIRDPSLEQTAQRLGAWRQEGRLPADAHGFQFNPDLANYCAWFAPAEKVFFDLRLNLSPGTARDYVRIRQAIRKNQIDRIDELLHARGVAYLALSESEGRDDSLRLATDLWPRKDFAFWDTDGRTFLFGWQDPQRPELTAALAGLRFDPVAKAFGPRPPSGPAVAVGATPEAPKEAAVSEQPGFWQRITAAPAPVPLSAHEALAYFAYAEYLERSFVQPARPALDAAWVGRALTAAEAGPGATVLNLIRFADVNQARPPELDDRHAALGVLAVRAARRAVADGPDDPEPYVCLEQAYSAFDTLADVRRLQQLAALQQAAARVPGPDECRRRSRHFDQVFERLSQVHQQRGRLDLALEYLQKAQQHLQRNPPAGVPAGPLQKALEVLDGRVKALEKQVREQRDDYDIKAKGAPLLLRVRLAVQHGLVREALTQLQKADFTQLANDAERGEAAEALLTLMLFQVGEVDEARRQLQDLASSRVLSLRVRDYRMMAAWMAGDLAQAADAQDGIRASIRHDLNQGLGVPEVKGLAETLGDFVFSDWVLQPLFRIGPLASAVRQPEPYGLGPYYFLTPRIAQARQEGMASLRRGLISLEAGDNKTAADFFRLARDRKDPPTPAEGRELARRYLRLLERH